MTTASRTVEQTQHSANRILKFPSNVPSFCSERPKERIPRNEFSVFCEAELVFRVDR